MTKSIRLDRYAKQAIVTAIMNDVPHVDYEEQQNALLTEWAVSRMPPKVHAVWTDKNLRHYVKLERFNKVLMGPHGEEKYVSAGYIPMPEDQHKTLPAELSHKLVELEHLSDEQSERWRELREKVRGLINGCSSTKQVRDTCPEFEKYLPKGEGSTISLPSVANVVTELMKEGWPKEAAA